MLFWPQSFHKPLTHFFCNHEDKSPLTFPKQQLHKFQIEHCNVVCLWSLEPCFPTFFLLMRLYSYFSLRKPSLFLPKLGTNHCRQNKILHDVVLSSVLHLTVNVISLNLTTVHGFVSDPYQTLTTVLSHCKRQMMLTFYYISGEKSEYWSSVPAS